MDSNVPEFDIKQMQKILKEALFVIDDVCKKHDITYYLIAGTMLGSVRHKGFVPWDDDGDVGMPRPDYDRFIANANEWLPKGYELVCNTMDENYPYAFARVQDCNTTFILRKQFQYVGGVPIDVFPLDGMTKNFFKRRFHYFRYNFYKRAWYYSTVNPYRHGKGFRMLFSLICHKIFSPAKLRQGINKVQKEFDYITSELVADHDNKPNRGILPKEVYGQPTPTIFEGRELMGVSQPDAYLKYCYHDYMTIPPLSQRPKLNFRYLDLNKPYKTYNGKC